MVGITSGGAEAEYLFEKLVYVATKTDRVPCGIKRVMLDDDSVHYVDVKKVGTVIRGVANQVRAIKYHTLAIFTPSRRNRWIVVPPNVVVEKAAERARGQHCEVPFETMALNLGSWTAKYICGDDDLEEKVIAAIKEGENHPALKRSMGLLLIDLKRKSHYARQEVQRILETGKPPEYWDLP